MKILISEGLIFHKTNSIQIKNSFFEPIDRYWGNYELRKHLNYDDVTLIEDINLSINIQEIVNDPKDKIGLGIIITEETQDKVNNLGILLKLKIIKLKTEVITHKKLIKISSDGNNSEIVYILPSQFLIENELNKENYAFLRIGKNEIGQYVIYIHDKNSESHNPIRIPGGQ